MCDYLPRSLFAFTVYAGCRNVSAEGKCDASQPTSNSFNNWFKPGHSELNATFVFSLPEFAEKKWVRHSHGGIAMAQLSPRRGSRVFTGCKDNVADAFTASMLNNTQTHNVSSFCVGSRRIA